MREFHFTEHQSHLTLTPLIPGIIVTKVAFFRITLRAIEAFPLFLKPFEPDNKKTVNARFARKGLVSLYTFLLNLFIIYFPIPKFKPKHNHYPLLVFTLNLT